MAMKISVAGATGNLGARITRILLQHGVEVVAIARMGTAEDKTRMLQSLGAKAVVVDAGGADHKGATGYGHGRAEHVHRPESRLANFERQNARNP